MTGSLTCACETQEMCTSATVPQASQVALPFVRCVLSSPAHQVPWPAGRYLADLGLFPTPDL